MSYEDDVVKESLRGLLGGGHDGPAAALPEWIMDPPLEAALPMSFTYGGVGSREFMGGWRLGVSRETLGRREALTLTFSEPGAAPRLKVSVTVTRYDGEPAMEWKASMENAGDADTPIIEAICSVDLPLRGPIPGLGFVLHAMKGGLSSAEDFRQRTVPIADGESHELHTAGGRSSNHDSPWFTVDSGGMRTVMAIGWSGQWRCGFGSDGDALTVRGGLEDCRFTLRPGESVALPSVLALFWRGDPEEAYGRFRGLILDEYVPRLPGRGSEPHLFCNTCFTRFGHWLNECDAANQSSLIRSLGPLGVEGVITDAGWFTGGWPDGAGNWDPDASRYPAGIGPVAEAASECGMRYGLWFEPERVCSGTALAKARPDLLLKRGGSAGGGGEGGGGTEHMLLNMGDPEAVDRLTAILAGFFETPGFTCYRQDFNMDPLEYWRANDAPDRVGITEIKYVNGLYGFLDRIRASWPGLFMDGCSSGGRRIDLEMVKRFHTHQKTDHWFDEAVDQDSLFALSHYLPCASFTCHANRYDDYSFLSAVPSSLCIGWIADSPEAVVDGIPAYDPGRARHLLSRYGAARKALNGPFHPLTPPRGESDRILASQYSDRAGANSCIFIYRKEGCPHGSFTVRPRGLVPGASYRLDDGRPGGLRATYTSEALSQGFEVTFGDCPEAVMVSLTRLP